MMKHNIIILLIILTTLISISPIRAKEWYKVYEDVKKDLNNYKWKRAIKKLEKLVKEKRKPKLRAPTYGTNYIEYLPYFYLGQAYFFAGNYNDALKNFRRSEQYKVIKSSTEYPILLSLKNAAQKITQPKTPEIPKEMKKRSEFEIDEKDTVLKDLITLYHAKKYSEAANYFLELSGTEKFISKKTLEEKDATIDYQQKFQEQFNQGLESYLTGDYGSALKKLNRLSKQYPDNHLIIKWKTKTMSELQQLQEKLPEGIDTVIVEKTITGAPVFSVRSLTSNLLEVSSQKISISGSSPPSAGDVTEVTSKTITISGTVGDDKGIKYIELTVNGTLFTNLNGDTVRLQPSADENPRRFPFKVEIPLQMGKNQITLIAYDVDSTQHSELFPFTVIRTPPFYETTLFYIILISLIILIIGIIVISKIIKHRIAIVNKYNPYIAGAPILMDEMFFGREELLHIIMNTLHHNSLMLYGPRRIGKTSMQHKLKRCLETINDPDFFYVPIYIDLQGVLEEKFFTSMMEDILDGCKNYLDSNNGLEFEFYKESEDSYTNRNFSRDLKKIISHLKTKSTKDLRLVLLMDEVDELNSYSDRINQRLRSIFMKTFAENLVAVMSGTRIRKNWESEGSPWYNFFEEIEVPPLKQEEAEELIKTPVKGIFSYSDSAVNKILEYSGSRPFVIQKFCIHSINKIIEERRRKVSVEDIEAVRELVFEE